MASEQDSVLLLTHSGDHYTVDRVAAALQRRGAVPVRLDSDRFPLELGLSLTTDGDDSQAIVELEGQAMDTRRVASVWLRQLWTPRLDDDIDPRYRAACLKECNTAVQAFLATLEDAVWVNPLQCSRLASDKPRQLRVAQAAGLTVPRTLVTNDPARVRQFYETLDRGMVTKLLSPLSSSMESTPFFMHTSEVTEADLDALDSLRLCPMIFQERIDKQCELRIVHVDDRLFVGAIDASQTTGATDWRRASPEECSWRADEVPDDIARGIQEMMVRLGLVYGAIDMIRTPAGEHVFLEVNPTGEWGMLERDLDFPISEALAAALWPK